MTPSLSRIFIAVAFGLLAAGAASADDLIEIGPDDAGLNPNTPRPKWELGIGLAGLHLPDYRGSDESRGFLVPLPYFVYRGTWLKADRGGARALLFDTDRTKVDVSLAASTPTRSRDNLARAGMPDLAATAEIGPNLNLTLARSARDRWKLDLRLPLRAAFTLQRSPRFAGTTFSPHLNLDVAGVAGGWNLGLLTGPLFADRRFHDRIYSVDAPQATAGRPAYQARGGYAGWQALTAVSRRFGNTWVGAFARYDTVSGASFDASPLVRRNSALTFGFGLSYVLASSTDLVARSAD